MKHEPNTDLDTDSPDAAEAPDTDFEALMDDPDTRALLTALAGLNTPVQVLHLGRSNRGPRSRELRKPGAVVTDTMTPPAATAGRATATADATSHLPPRSPARCGWRWLRGCWRRGGTGSGRSRPRRWPSGWNLKYAITPSIALLSDLAVAAVTEPDRPRQSSRTTGRAAARSMLLAVATPVWALMRDPDLQVVAGVVFRRTGPGTFAGSQAADRRTRRPVGHRAGSRQDSGVAAGGSTAVPGGCWLPGSIPA